MKFHPALPAILHLQDKKTWMTFVSDKSPTNLLIFLSLYLLSSLYLPLLLLVLVSPLCNKTIKDKKENNDLELLCVTNPYEIQGAGTSCDDLDIYLNQ